MANLEELDGVRNQHCLITVAMVDSDGEILGLISPANAAMQTMKSIFDKGGKFISMKHASFCSCRGTLDETDFARCPACGDPIDYCQGHGEFADPVGFAILAKHDDGNHGDCVGLSDCKKEERSV